MCLAILAHETDGGGSGNSVADWESRLFIQGPAELPEPGPASHSAAFAEVSLQQAHTADSVTLVIRQDWHDGKDYVEMVHGVGTQQLLLDDVQLSVSTCGPPPRSAPLAPVTRRSAADRAADRATAAEALAAQKLPGERVAVALTDSAGSLRGATMSSNFMD